LSRSSTLRSQSGLWQSEDPTEPPNEVTSLLRSRSFRRRRRRSTGFPGFMARPRPLSPKRTSTLLQSALGGFWKTKWFRHGLRGPPDPGADPGADPGPAPDRMGNGGAGSSSSGTV
jgi:hypothetical protein